MSKATVYKTEKVRYQRQGAITVEMNEEIRAMLDALVSDFATAADNVSKTGVIRKLIFAEFKRRKLSLK